MEQSFADATKNRHFNRAAWRPLWRQQIQDYLIAAIQNLRILLAHHKPRKSVARVIGSLQSPPAKLSGLLTIRAGRS
jgi:hypothetical protein